MMPKEEFISLMTSLGSIGVTMSLAGIIYNNVTTRLKESQTKDMCNTIKEGYEKELRLRCDSIDYQLKEIKKSLDREGYL